MLLTSGKEVIQKQKDIDKGFLSEQTEGTMILTSARGKETIRQFDYYIYEETPTQGSKSLMKVLFPADLRGVGLLGHQNKERDDDQWLYLPAVGKTKRIVGGSKKGRFIGSDFTYEDLSPRNIEDYSYKLIKTEPCLDTICYVIESLPVNIKSQYSKSIAWIRNDNFQTIKLDLYDNKGVHIKTSFFEDYTLLLNQYWRSRKVIMKDLKKKRRTTLVFKNIKLKAGLTDSKFSKTALER